MVYYEYNRIGLEINNIRKELGPNYLVKCLSCKHEALGSIPRIHVENLVEVDELLRLLG